jgi:hypothetical protein
LGEDASPRQATTGQLLFPKGGREISGRETAPGDKWATSLPAVVPARNRWRFCQARELEVSGRDLSLYSNLPARRGPDYHPLRLECRARERDPHWILAAFVLPQQLRQPRDVDGDAPRLVLRQRLRIIGAYGTGGAGGGHRFIVRPSGNFVCALPHA